VFPEDSGKLGSGGPADLVLYPDLVQNKKIGSRLLKRSIDILGSLFALAVSSPALLAVSVIVKLTSEGPILFRQERVGQYGRRFTFLKFRSMYSGNDHAIHQEYVKNLIAGKVDSDQGTYKLTNDPRVTPIGKFLRKTSLDEFPQFFNVLKGEMSLVGPRPPILYEFEAYSPWQRRRMMTVKPGITGLWQVGGRSRVKFDDMVRLDLKYARTWSLWLDLKILGRTPRAVFSGDGAY
jgi:lipopolysaccharide/colanic/teichoic acid biosynthesis glycosyltransferase